jgi:phenylalanyl-tRNA synthetase beta chain
MRVPMRWLRSYCDPPLDTAAVAAALNDAGVELGRVERVGVGSLDGFVVGRVLSAEQHPNADRLRVCTVDDGSPEPRTIVCGAPNVAAGQTVAVARPGALMPNGEPLGEATLRGVRSSGMILAEDELGVGPDHSGILVLRSDLAPGSPLAEVLPIQDEVLELEVSPNRPDCLGVYGVAREVHALTGAPLAEDPTAAGAQPRGDDDADAHAGVEIVDPDVCLRFTARVFEDVHVGPSPPWLRARLTAAGQRPISNVVDITNYVMLVTGQPLHAFDLDKVRGRRLIIRRAREDERLRTLDGVERVLDRDVAVVADVEGPLGIAGIVGGESSEVSDTTTRVLMEAATWVGPNILRTSARLGVRTEASTRFEKQLHPEGAYRAQQLAAALMVELCGARLVDGTLDEYPRPLDPRTIELRLGRVERLLGERVAAPEVERILTALGFAVVDADESLPERLAEVGDSLLEQLAVATGSERLREHPLRQTIASLGGGGGAARREVTVPSFRDGDVQREADLIEEIARVHGVDRLPTSLPARRRAVGRLSVAGRLRRRLEDALRDRGLSECVSYSFTSEATLARLRLGGEPIRLANPLSEQQAVLRPLVLPGLLDAASRNTAYNRAAVALFESAHAYAGLAGGAHPLEGSPRGATPALERHHIAAVLTQASPSTWRSGAIPADFFAAKALVERLLSIARIGFRTDPSNHPFLHPARQAAVVAGERVIGFVGELHPTVAAEWDLAALACCCFELDFDTIAELAPGPSTYEPLSTYPPVTQDIAVVVPEDVAYGEIEGAVRAASALLVSVDLFDAYRGEQVGAGKKSLALRLEFRAPDRTLTDDEVAAERERIAGALAAVEGSLRA